MNTKFISREYNVAVFVDENGLIANWHYGTDSDEDDDGYWYDKATGDGGNGDIFNGAIRYVTKHGVDDPDDLPGIYLTPTEHKTTGAAGPTLLLLEWPIEETDGSHPFPIFSVHTTDDNGKLIPPLPDVLARRFAKAVTKNNK